MKENIKEFRLNLRIRENEGKELREIARILDIPFSQIAREGVREKVESLRTHPRVVAAQVQTA